MQKSGASKELNETADLLRQAFARAEAAELQVEEGKIAAVGAGVAPASQAGVASAALSQVDVSVEVGAIAGGISSVGGVGGSSVASPRLRLFVVAWIVGSWLRLMLTIRSL